VKNIILILYHFKAPEAGFSDRRQVGEVFDWKREYSSPGMMKLSPKYSSPAEKSESEELGIYVSPRCVIFWKIKQWKEVKNNAYY
jgi:hypothetical protein